MLISQLEYNETGQLLTKHLHKAQGSTTFLQDISFAYNERGWLSKINDPTVAPTATKMFAEQLNYNVPQFGGLAQFNGNIAEQDYNAATGGRQQVKYGYDNLNRLNAGNSTAGFSETGISYDDLGNIKSLTRAGTGNGTLTYTYTNGNQLASISGFKTGIYTYDANGNATTDGTRGATIAYNLLNLPRTVTATGGVNLTYTYDATGNKLRKVSGTTTTEYIDGIQYTNTNIDFVQTEEGRAINAGSAYNYEYTLTDHLGNNRLTFDMTNGKVGEDDYYPFGLNVHRLVNGTNNYLYNKKELQPELTEYDYGARFYDPVIARWNTVDPLAEMSRKWTPYNYVEDDPIRFTDPDGMACAGCRLDPSVNPENGKPFDPDYAEHHPGDVPKPRFDLNRPNDNPGWSKVESANAGPGSGIGASLPPELMARVKNVPKWLWAVDTFDQEIPVLDVITDAATLYYLLQNTQSLQMSRSKKGGELSKNISDSQRDLIRKWFVAKKNLPPGAPDPELPKGITKETLKYYRAIAQNAIDEGIDKGVQEIRRDMIDKVLKALGN